MVTFLDCTHRWGEAVDEVDGSFSIVCADCGHHLASFRGDE